MTSLLQQLQAVFDGAGTPCASLEPHLDPLGKDARLAFISALVQWGNETNTSIWPSEIRDWQVAVEWMETAGAGWWTIYKGESKGNCDPVRVLGLYRSKNDDRVSAVAFVRMTVADALATLTQMGTPLAIIAAHGPDTQFERVF